MPAFQRSAPVAPASLPLDIPGLDVAGSLRRLGGREALYINVLKLFVQQHAGSAAIIREALRSGRSDDARQEAHALRGAAGNVGAQDVCERAWELERALVAGDTPDQLSALAEALALPLETLVQALHDRLP